MSGHVETLERFIAEYEDSVIPNYEPEIEAIRAVVEENKRLGEALRDDHAALFTAEVRIEATEELLQPPDGATDLMWWTPTESDGEQTLLPALRKALRGEK